MKKNLTLIVIALLVLSMAVAGCSKKESSTTPASTEYNPEDYVKLFDYAGLPYYTQEFEVTDEEVNEEIDMELQYATEVTNITEGVVEDGDTINIAFEGKIDGETFDGGSSESYDLTVGTTSMIDGFVEGLVGKQIGETVTLNLKFPEDYGVEELNGKDVVFDVTINSKRESTTPELTDEFVKENYDYETVDEYKAHVKEVLLKQKEDSHNSNIKSQLWHIILEESELTGTPDEEKAIADEIVAGIEEEYKANAESYGMEWADFVSAMMGTDEEGFAEMMAEYSDSLIKTNVVTKAIAAKESVSFTEKEYKDMLLQLLADNNMTEETFQTYYNMTIEEYGEQNNWRDNYLLEKVLDKVVELGKEVSEDEFNAYMDEHNATHEHEEEVIEGVEDAETTEEEAIEELEEVVEDVEGEIESEVEDVLDETAEGAEVEAEETSENSEG